MITCKLIFEHNIKHNRTSSQYCMLHLDLKSAAAVDLSPGCDFDLDLNSVSAVDLTCGHELDLDVNLDP